MMGADSNWVTPWRFGQPLVVLILERPPEAQAGGGTLEQQEVHAVAENVGVGAVQHL